jgi:hypothetical protein
MLLSCHIKSVLTSIMGKTENVNIHVTLLQESVCVKLRIHVSAV